MAVVFDMKRCPEACNLQVGDSVDCTPNKDGGVIKKLMKAGVGDEFPNYGDKVFFNYTAYKGDEMTEENIFDSSEKDGEQFEYDCLRGKVIRGFELAVLSMRPGERSLIYLTPEWGFGKSGAPPRVPPDTNVIFDTEIVSVECSDISPDQDQTLMRKVLVRGKGHHHANFGCPVELHIRGECDGQVFIDKDVNFFMGEGSSDEHGIPPFIEPYLDHWKNGEEARINYAAKHAYGAAGCPKYGIEPNKDLVFWINMKKFERVQEYWDLDYKQKMDRSDEYKIKGNKYFKNGEYDLASKFYEEMIDFVQHDLCMEGAEEKRRRNLLLVGNLNLAQAYLKVDKNTKARDCCDTALTFDEKNVKAFFRRGMAYLGMMEYEKAKKDFQKVLELEPYNMHAKKHIDICTNKMVETTQSERDLDRRMMSGIGKHSDDGSSLYSSGMDDIDNWDNNMAQGMMPLEEEQAAFGDISPSDGGNNHGLRD
ncbi:peptidyl-prolyl cis-trans isomerase FKBP5-like [Mya arenaria]|uniref:peptidyl-prolyl cis-trans isomerase FKBP5-like n=1 Tax=Mya arenaria TaxID=6604 RepID=UPI0022E50089|nr:peptidyl-prolyl cis-trans isomerase FKBP5-like [Mya arenaria]